MINWILRTIVMGIVVMIAANYIGNIKVANVYVAIEVAFLVAFVNATLGTLLRLFTLPISIITLGFSSFIISVMMIALVDYLLVGFSVTGIFTYAKFGFTLSVARMLVGLLFKD